MGMKSFIRGQAQPKSGTSRAFPLFDESGSLKEVLLIDLAEMMAVNGKRNGQWQQFWAAKTSPYQELPIMDSLFAYNAEVVDGTKEG